MKRKSNQRITKIKRDRIEDLLKQAENTNVQDGTVIQEAGAELVPYPNFDQLRTWTRKYITKGLNKILINNIDQTGKKYITTLIDGLPLFTKTSKTVGISATTQIETTKPGLWLSNLIQPRSATTAGSYICHNLINTTPLDTPNLDTLGQYSYSFLQRGIYHRTSGSVHYNHDSYAQHWSPSYLSCISHDSLIIPFNNLRRTYTPYQTLVFPKDPDMQEYEETASKDIEYKFVNNDDQTIPTITDFNGRIVGEGWSYEFMFTPNGDGSGNNYGDGGNPGNDNGSNGGCMTGTITYSDSAYENSYCTQTINTCFQTIGSYFNPNVPDLSNYKLLDQGDNNPNMYSGTLRWDACCSNPFVYVDGKNQDLTINNPCTISVRNFSTQCEMKVIINVCDDDNCSTVTHTETSQSDNAYCYTRDQRCGVGGSGIGLNGVSVDGNGGFCGSTTATANFALADSPPEPLTGVDIYMIITDLKCQYEDQGLPWTHRCGTDRFTYYFSTQKSTNKCDKNILIASNININKLGDISKLNSGNFKG